MDFLTICPDDIVRHISSFLYYNPDVARLSIVNKSTERIEGLYVASQHRSGDVVDEIPSHLEDLYQADYARLQDGLPYAPYYYYDWAEEERLNTSTRVGQHVCIISSFHTNGMLKRQICNNKEKRKNEWRLSMDSDGLIYKYSHRLDEEKCADITVDRESRYIDVLVHGSCLAYSLEFDFNGKMTRDANDKRIRRHRDPKRQRCTYPELSDYDPDGVVTSCLSALRSSDANVQE